MGAWYLGNVIAGMAGGLIAYGIGRVESIAPWKVLEDIYPSLNLISLTCHAGSLPCLRRHDSFMVGRHFLLPARYPDERQIPQRARPHQSR